MSVKKYRSVEEMPPPPRRRASAPRDLELAISMSDACRRLRPNRFPRGVHKNRSVEAAQARRRSWLDGEQG